MRSLLVVLLFVASSRTRLLRDERCITSGGEVGFCEQDDLCQSALEEIRQNKKPNICYFVRKTPMVCCARPAEPGFKANKMCEEYLMFTRHERQVVPHMMPIQSDDVGLILLKPGKKEPAIVGGYLTLEKTYPHMAAIGFGGKDSISWLCGGSLISERFVLTTAHCVSASGRGLARWVLLGVTELTRRNESSYAQLISVVKRIRHPDYKTYSRYHDIALLRLDRKARIDDYVKPACLDFGEIMSNSVVATGWGLVDWGDEQGSNDLMSVDLMLEPGSVCNTFYRSMVGTRQLMLGIQDDKMICVGWLSGGKDTCRGDSGGPLHYSFDNRRVVGVTAFGSMVCGARNSPAVYTRVSYYVPWIEDIIWSSPYLG